MPQIEFTFPPPVSNEKLFNRYMQENHFAIYGLGSGTKGLLDFENIPGLAIDASIQSHMDDATIHFVQSAISITESQVSDLQSYLLNITNEPIATLSDVYSTMAPTDGQVLTFDTTNGWQAETLPAAVADHGALSGLTDDDHTQYALLAGRAGGQAFIGGSATGEALTLNSNTSNDGAINFGSLVNVDEATGKTTISPTLDGMTIGFPANSDNAPTALTIGSATPGYNGYQRGFNIMVEDGMYGAIGAKGGDVTVATNLISGYGIKSTMSSMAFDAGFIADMPIGNNIANKGFKATTASAYFTGDLFYGDFQNAASEGNFLNLNTPTGQKFAVNHNGDIINYGAYINPRGTIGKVGNLLRHSNSLDNAIWVKTGFTIAANSDSGPDGSQTVDKATATAYTDTIIQDIGLDPAGKTYTLGFFFKTAANTQTRIYLESGNESAYYAPTYLEVTAWKYYSITNTFTGGSTGNLQVRILAQDASAVVYFTDGMLSETSSPIGYTAAADAAVPLGYGASINGMLMITACDENSAFHHRAGDGQSANLYELQDSAGVVQVKVDTSYHTTRNDNIKSIFGTGGDSEISYNGSRMVINPDVVGTGELQIDGDAWITGDTGLGTGTPVAKLHIVQTSSNKGITLERDSASVNDAIAIKFKVSTDDADAYQKGAIIYRRLASSGRGEFIIAVDGTNDSSNAGQADAQLRLHYSTGVECAVDFRHTGPNLSFYSAATIAQQTGVAVTDVAIHAALVNLGLITA